MHIDDTGFELGQPTQLELIEQHNNLLMAENDRLREALARATGNVAKLVSINEVLQLQASQEKLRANKEHVLRIQTLNRLRTAHGIDASTWFS